ncbi:MAG: hypothetical protein NVSMB31_20020 [Vulcanimicrobiaceae bacterium]
MDVAARRDLKLDESFWELLINSQLLYQLSYSGIAASCLILP